ncbi:MAG TPA: hypothetical protein VF828_00525 [Patescibacteria group bacterium]
MKTVIFDVHGLVDYKAPGGILLTPILLNELKKQNDKYRIMFWTRGSQKEGYNFLKSHGINESDDKKSLFYDLKRRQQKLTVTEEIVNEARPYVCIGHDTAGYFLKLARENKDDELTDFLKVMDIKKSKEEFKKEAMQWREDIGEGTFKNPLLFTEKGEEAILVESDNAQFSENKEINQYEDYLERDRCKAAELGYSLFIIPESDVIQAGYVGKISSMDIFKELRRRIESEEKVTTLDIGRHFGIYNDDQERTDRMRLI